MVFDELAAYFRQVCVISGRSGFGMNLLISALDAVWTLLPYGPASSSHGSLRTWGEFLLHGRGKGKNQSKLRIHRVHNKNRSFKACMLLGLEKNWEQKRKNPLILVYFLQIEETEKRYLHAFRIFLCSD